MTRANGRTAPRRGGKLGDFARRHGLLTASAAVLVLATITLELARDPQSGDFPILDSLYHSLQMFVLAFEMPAGAATKPVLAWLLTALSYAAVVIASSALLGVFAQRVGEPLRLYGQALRHRSAQWPPLARFQGCWKRKRAVLLGFGKVNRAIAQALTAQRYNITAIDERFDEAAQLMARNSRVLLVPGDLYDTASLERGRIGDAEIVVISAGNDVTNIEIAAAAQTLVPGANIYAHVASPGFADGLRESIDAGFPLAEGVRTFSVRQESARNLLRRAHLAREARERGQGVVHLVIVGMGDLGEAILLEALQSATSVGLAGPRITVVDKDAASIEAHFKGRRPVLSEISANRENEVDAATGESREPCFPKAAKPIIRYVARDVDATDFTSAKDDWADGVPVTAYVFCCGEDATNLAAGLRLEHAMSIGRQAPAPIFLNVWGAGIDLDLYDGRDPLGHCVLFGAAGPTISGATFLRGDPDTHASALHDAYEDQRVASKQGSNKRAWEQMPQTMKESNRRALRHSHVKLLDLDLHWRGMGAADLPVIEPAVAEALRQVSTQIDSPAILAGRVDAPVSHRRMAELAETEHRRWLLDRAVDGWRFATDREDTARLHPNMVSFEKLRPDYQHYDTVLVRSLIERFVQPEHAAAVAYGAKRSRLVIEEKGGFDGAILPKSTEVTVVFPAQFYELPATPDDDLTKMLVAWTTTPQASRLRVVLEKRFAAGIPDTPAARAASYLRALVKAIPRVIDVSIIRTYGVDARPETSGMAPACTTSAERDW